MARDAADGALGSREMDPRGEEAVEEEKDPAWWSSNADCLVVSGVLVVWLEGESWTEDRDFGLGAVVLLLGDSWEMEPLGVEDTDDDSDGEGCWIVGGLVRG